MRDRKSRPLYGRHYMSGGSSVHVPESNSVQRMRSAVGHVIYACEMPDGTIKIGWTSDFGKRKQKLGAGAQVLALWPTLAWCPTEPAATSTTTAHPRCLRWSMTCAPGSTWSHLLARCSHWGVACLKAATGDHTCTGSYVSGW